MRGACVSRGGTTRTWFDPNADSVGLLLTLTHVGTRLSELEDKVRDSGLAPRYLSIGFEYVPVDKLPARQEATPLCCPAGPFPHKLATADALDRQGRFIFSFESRFQAHERGGFALSKRDLLLIYCELDALH